MTKLDVLAFGAHPDDVELAASGTLIKLANQGKTTGIVDLTRGELGTRGSAEIRDKEAAAAAIVMDLKARHNLGLADGFFEHNETNLKKVITAIRMYQPEVVLAPAIVDRHSDHGRGSKLVRDACFLSGLKKIETSADGQSQEQWRPKRIFFYIQDYSLQPDFVVDISGLWEQKKDAILAFGSQFYNPEFDGEETYISNKDFFKFQEARARNMGHIIGTSHGEGFQSETALAVDTPLDLL
ncbi:MAG: bacillithiol biosynthesis deacetylase BshB1 [Bacteroidia bacterium]